jgi:hypothetical protein
VSHIPNNEAHHGSAPGFDLQEKAYRARGLARQATEERQRLERMLADAKQKETLACNAALLAEAEVLAIKAACSRCGAETEDECAQNDCDEFYFREPTA